MLNDIRKFISNLKNVSPSFYVVKRQRTPEGVDCRIVSYADRDSYVAEQYKIMRTNLYSLSPEKPLKAIVITSAHSQEGKTLTACNLSFSLSLDAEKKILLIDADLRKPSVHSMFGLPRKPGITDFLTKNMNINDLLIKPSVERLFVMPAGSIINNPAEILSSAKIKSFIEQLKLQFDYIIIDTPPALNVTDASILGAYCDGVILVVKAGVTQKNIIEEAFNLLRDAQAKPKACVLSNSEIPLYHYYYRYKYYYRYSYGKDKRDNKKGR